MVRATGPGIERERLTFTEFDEHGAVVGDVEAQELIREQVQLRQER